MASTKKVPVPVAMSKAANSVVVLWRSSQSSWSEASWQAN